MNRLVLLRHGESVWNQENRFTGWTDVDLSQRGVDEAHAAGRILKSEGFTFDVAFTSVLKRAIRTLWIVLDELDSVWIPVYKDWHLNERHYGGLQGLNKAEMAARHGDEQVHIWRRSFDVRPPALKTDSTGLSSVDPKYRTVPLQDLPAGESLEDTVNRFMPYWRSTIAPIVSSGKHVLIAAHGNSLRALVMHLDNLSRDKITELNIPTGIPLVYELDSSIKPVRHYYLGDPAAVDASVNKVLQQGKT